jgi:hypothetical protein
VTFREIVYCLQIEHDRFSYPRSRAGSTSRITAITSACGVRGQAQPSAQSFRPWTLGFWYWGGSYGKPAQASEPADVIFLRVGELRGEPYGFHTRVAPSWYAFGQIPDHIPPAREYWLVYRYERQGLPDKEVIPILASEITRLRAESDQRHLNVVGLQLDIDSPTGSLAEYASFLKAVRAALPTGFQLSITALLDWFRDGAHIGDVIAQVDEFVPQFYDVEPLDRKGIGAIAARIDAAHWDPILNRFGKRFRVGVAAFGRTRFVRAKPNGPGYQFAIFGDIDEREFSANPNFHFDAKQTEAGELSLTYVAERTTKLGYRTFEPGDLFQVIIPTPAAVHSAVIEARKIRGHNAGVVFFRWPGMQERAAMPPDEVLRAASATPPPPVPKYTASTVDGHCAAVACVNLSIAFQDALEPQPVTLRVHSSVPFEYFLPERNVPVRLKDASDLEFTVPPYGARGRVLLGRAVTITPSHFTLEQH